jgi:hypothetical protein
MQERDQVIALAETLSHRFIDECAGRHARASQRDEVDLVWPETEVAQQRIVGELRVARISFQPAEPFL